MLTIVVSTANIYLVVSTANAYPCGFNSKCLPLWCLRLMFTLVVATANVYPCGVYG